jgi:hypothetical protein
MGDEELTEVYRAANNVQAYMIVSVLEDDGIKATVDGESLQSGLGATGMGWSVAPRIMVHSSDEGKARSIIERLEQRKHATK